MALGAAQAVDSAKSFYDFSVEGIDGKKVALSQYKGKVALVVNTASKCGYTPQYKALEALYEKYKGKGLVILGFPSNDFGQQEPGSNQEIKKFCELKYSVTFPLFSKNHVKGPETQTIYRFLTDNTAPKEEVAWNFEKFLVDKSGKVVGRYKSKIEPTDSELVKKIESLL